jgi:hypothetical protein
MSIYIVVNKATQKTPTLSELIKTFAWYLVSPKIKQWNKHEKKCESSKMNKSIGGNKRIVGTYC